MIVSMVLMTTTMTTTGLMMLHLVVRESHKWRVMHELGFSPRSTYANMHDAGV